MEEVKEELKKEFNQKFDELKTEQNKKFDEQKVQMDKMMEMIKMLLPKEQIEASEDKQPHETKEEK